MNKVVYLMLLIVFTFGCSAKLIIQSEPSQANIFVNVEGRTAPIKIGQTPLEVTEVQLAETLKLTPESSQWIEFSFEKKDFLNRKVMLPSNRWGESTKIIKINLPPSADQTTVAKKIINYFFNAKKFAETKQYDQAHSEIDKILEIDSKFSQAITMKAGIYFLQEKMEDAKKLYKDALTIDPASTDAIQMLERIQNKSSTP